MDKAGIFDCAFIVDACRRQVYSTIYAAFFGGLSLGRKIRFIAGYHHGLTLGIYYIVSSVHQCLLLCWKLYCISVPQSVSK